MKPKPWPFGAGGLRAGNCQKPWEKPKKPKKPKKIGEINLAPLAPPGHISNFFLVFLVFLVFPMVFYSFLPLVRQRPKGQGLGFTMAWKQKIWHSWIHAGKRIAWNNLWSGALDSCVYRTNHWGVASCRGPPAPKGQGLGFTVARKQKA